ncbi:hypothetical protein HQ560_03885 [bacterium]|nr:hypothetical protein [bacterium]
MARKKGVRITILVEDKEFARFSQAALLALGFSRRELRVMPYPVGKGSNKAWVDKQYPGEVRLLRTKAHHQKVGIVVGTDADEMTVDQRVTRLAAALKKENVEARGNAERIVLWVPKWHIETWLLHFAGGAVDENTNYKNKVKKPNYRATAKAFLAQYREYKGDSTILTQPSLRSAYEETGRLGL